MTIRSRAAGLRALAAVIVALSLLFGSAVPAQAVGSATITGRVTVRTDTGFLTPLPGTLTFRAEKWNGSGWDATSSTTTNGSDGSFTLSGLDAGEYRIQTSGTTGDAYVTSYVPSLGRITIPDDSAAVEYGRIVVDTYRNVSVAVTAPDGSPITAGEASVSVLLSNNTATGVVATVGVGGLASLRLAPNSYKLVVDYTGASPIFDRTVSYSVPFNSGPSLSTAIQLEHIYTMTGHLDLGGPSNPAGPGDITLSEHTHNATFTIDTDGDRKSVV